MSTIHSRSASRKASTRDTPGFRNPSTERILIGAGSSNDADERLPVVRAARPWSVQYDQTADRYELIRKRPLECYART